MEQIARQPRKGFISAFLKLALPMMGQTLMMATMQVVDNVLVGRLQLGEYAISGVSQANRVSFLFQLAVFGMTGGASAFFAQYWGKRDREGIERTLNLSVVAGLLIALLFAVPSILAPQRLLGLLIASDRAVEIGAVYLRIVAISFFPYAVSMALGASLKSTERVVLPMYASIAGVTIDAVMSYVLIFGRFGAPRLEVAGAAAGSVLGVVAEMLILASVGLYKKYISLSSVRRMLCIPRDFVVKFMKIALPVMGNELMWALGIVAYSATYGNMKDAAIATAAVNIFSNVEVMASVVLRGATQAAAVMIGISIGAGREAQARQDAWRALKVNVVIAALTAVPVFLFGGLVTEWFKVADATKFSALRLMQIYAFALPLMAANSVMIVGIFRPGGDAAYSMCLDLLPLWLVGVPLSVLAAFILKLPVQYVFLASRCEDLAKVIFALRRLNSGKWVHNLVKR